MADGKLFPSTRDSAIGALLSGEPVRVQAGLEAVARAYWKPVYKYLRLRWSKSPADAEDLTQAFFAVAIDRDTLARYEASRGRFRTFLRTCVDRYVIDEHRRASAARRGGLNAHVDFAHAEAELTRAHGDPADAFDAEWLRHIMQLALDRLDRDLGARGKPVHAALFRALHTGDEQPTYAEVAARFGITHTDVTNWLFVARREFRRVALELLRELTLDDDDFAAEARAVFGIDVAR